MNTNDTGTATANQMGFVYTSPYQQQAQEPASKCPNCGYCPTCGRSNGSHYPYPTWPYNTYPTYVWNYDTNSMATPADKENYQAQLNRAAGYRS